MSNIFDKFINLMKWPVALWLLFSLPAFLKSVDYFRFADWKYLALFAGFFCFFIARSFMDSSARVGMEVLAHELTHAFFALLTFHKVKGISINPDDSGGNMSFEGEGNWLIIIAPYFFPFFGMLAMISISIYTIFAPMNLILNGVMGFFIGYHLDTVWSQIHEKQTDLPKVGYYFCAVFLLPANLWMIGSMMAFNSRGWQGVLTYQRLISYLNDKNFGYVLNFLGL
ncbi:MAG: hypothetical protein E7020_03875 [Alphaproteobacteria bacterium]|nr:hypothetical protein [Alphaproteobacteria bacterium]